MLTRIIFSIYLEYDVLNLRCAINYMIISFLAELSFFMPRGIQSNSIGILEHDF